MVDMSKLLKARAELEERQNRSSGDFPMFNFWKPTNGSNEIRILPPWDNEGEFKGVFWREVYQHWGVGGADKNLPPLVCISKTPGLDDDCPICEFVEELRLKKDDPKALQMVKDIRAKVTYALAIIDMKDTHYTAADVAEAKQARPDAEVPFGAGDLKVKVYCAPTTVFNSILGLITENNEDITHAETGRNIKVIRSGKGLNTSYEVNPSFKAEPVDLGKQSLEDVLIDLSKFGVVKDRNEMLSLLQEGVGGDYVALPATVGKAPRAALNSAVGGDDDVVGDSEGDDGDDLASRLRAKAKKAG